MQYRTLLLKRTAVHQVEAGHGHECVQVMLQVSFSVSSMKHM